MVATLVGGKRRRRRSVRKTRKRRKTKKVGKMGSKSNPYPSKAAACRGKKRGVKHFKKKGRTLKLKSKKC
tara:strand:- start:33 stop:242 length:210 start_codon:yes stop_codon:yes gene_type:complete